jgi:hypothetical protein
MVTASGAPDLSAILPLISVLTLLVLLVQKELTAGAREGFLRSLCRVLNIGIVPLLIVFACIVAVKLVPFLK